MKKGNDAYCSRMVNRIFSIAMIFAGLLNAASTLTSFKPGQDWKDSDGKIIDCHAGNIIHQAETGTFFWFGEHRGSPSGVACYSSKDLYNWKNEGIALNKSTAGLSGGIIERPKVAYNANTKKYVMWFHYDSPNYSLAHQGVAMCDSAPGPYTFLEHFAPNGHESRDMGMFSDDDGKTYIGYASKNNSEVRMVELSEDYLNVTKNDVVTGAHCEGPAVLKWNGLYYLLTSQCQGWTPNPATYYTSPKILATFTSKGSPCIDDTKKTTFDSQPSSILKVPGYADGFIYIGDRWNGVGSTKSQYVFLPIFITSDGKMQLKWYDEWKLDVFTPLSIDGKNPSGLGMAVRYTNDGDGSLHGYDLLGRGIPSLYHGRGERTVMNIHHCRTNNRLPVGLYLLR